MHNNINFHALLNTESATFPDRNLGEPCCRLAVTRLDACSAAHTRRTKMRSALQDRRAMPDYTGG
ncbi:hypothetical protein LJ655_28570 [Paraburkholderia sp. MMS20-SJTN17]|uniref:Uncharacterized protein n=1 Tax=Paraburkholderia translucens TaxID=2886945 RepID=A0ABS8KMY9_9BURK|nr:hypothetical protein [Paraburkholderia sp. MMS20-SJTN17]MCC8405764.1 hypothetical protein [Paraburkholderia sp. MMS20-SJTN17]